MENNSGIMGLREDEIELELRLSIGGSLGKAEKLKPIKKETKPNDLPVVDLGESLVFDPQMKRKIQALRRQEAKKKREEKQQKRGTTIPSRSRDDVTEERECKKNKAEEFFGGVNLNLSIELNNPPAYPVFPVRVPCPYPNLLFVPLANGFPYPCVNSVPCWGEKGMAMNGGFQTGRVHHGNNGYDSEQYSSKDERNRKTGSNESPMYSSSVVSDLQSSSNQGGRSSESGTNTSPCQPAEHTQINCSAGSNQKGRSEQSCTSHQNDSAQSMDKCSKGGIEKTPSVESTSLNLKKAPPKPEIKTSNSTKDTNKGEMGKPPKPPAPPIHDCIVSLRSMPCVSTTGNGPDGKTINGFLYRFTKSEVSIICVCHGNSFSPAEFVQHAGGSDVSHPLRHITVIHPAVQQM
ncbi:hypothetical protein ES332_A11G159500v1 [Gossypium tomentosum]|uniref:Ninja-family protein n=1 Tax=Gossypium tomentosum TaxID=34277 RepID=A0A5D2NA20_GOSTO|nr:hypothetical protein ES332_A11G159500v1 [Gossypium tomentosum]